MLSAEGGVYEVEGLPFKRLYFEARAQLEQATSALVADGLCTSEPYESTSESSISSTIST